MRSLASAVAAAIDERALPKVGRLVAITKPDGTVIRSSTFGAFSAVYDGNTYAGSVGFDFSDMTMSNSGTHPTVDAMTAAGDGNPLTFTEAAGGLISGATVQIFVFIVGEGGHELGSKWYVAGTSLDDAGQFDLDIKSVSAQNRQLVLRTMGPGCRWDLGGYGCGVDMAPFTDAVSVVTNPDLFTLTISGPSPLPADDYYANGVIKFTSGALNGISRTVRKFVSSTGTIKLAEPLPFAASASDTASVHAGCDKSADAAGCGRFSNFAKRLAWDHLPDENLSVSQIVEQEATQTVTEESGGFYAPYAGALGGWG